MSLDDLLPLLLVAAFVINAVVRSRRSTRRGRGTSPPGRRAGRSPSDAGPAEQGADAPSTPQPSATQRSDGPTASGPRSLGDQLTERLEEARRRVREASEGGEGAPRTDTGRGGGAPSGGGTTGPSGGSGTLSGGTVAPAGGTGTVGSPASRPATAPTRPPPGFLGREGTAPSAADAAPGDGSLGREGGPRRRRTPSATAGADGRRTQPPKSARLPIANVLGTGREDVVRGVMWSVVLGEPVGTRLRRRKVSQRRSP